MSPRPRSYGSASTALDPRPLPVAKLCRSKIIDDKAYESLRVRCAKRRTRAAVDNPIIWDAWGKARLWIFRVTRDMRNVIMIVMEMGGYTLNMTTVVLWLTLQLWYR